MPLLPVRARTTRQKRHRKHRSAASQGRLDRRLRVETLEARQLLAAITGGTGTGGFELADGASSLRMWLDSTDTSTLFTDTAATTVVSNQGDPVARWNDKSGYNLNVQQDSAANQPIYSTSVANLNAQPAVSFVGGAGGDALSSPTGNSTGISGNADRTIINVWASTGFTSQNFQHTFHMGTTNCNEAYGISASRAGNAGSPIGNHYWCAGFDTSAPASTNPNIAVAAWDGDGGTAGNGLDQWHVNGANVGASDQAPLATGTNEIQIGSRLAPFTEGFSGNMVEVMVFDRVLSDAERSITENALGAKYGIAVSNDLYAGDSPANGNYDLGVFGIGQDANGGVVATAGAAGFGIEDTSSLEANEYALAGYRQEANGYAAHAVGRRWTRDWYVDITGSVAATLAFDHSDAGLPDPGGVTYSLLYSADGSDFQVVAGVTPLVLGDRVSFALPATLLQDGYYTLADDTAVDPPLVTTSAGNLFFEPGDLPRAIDNLLTVTDTDSTDLIGATVGIAAGYAPGQDVLAFADQLGITGSFDAVTGVLTLSGTTSIDNYQTALRTVTYQNIAFVPTTAVRTVAITADDGDVRSDPATREIELTTRLITGGYGPGGIEPVNGAAGLRMWLDAADTSTLFTDTAGATPVANSGDAVARWNDKSGYALNVEQASAGNTPSFTTAVNNLNSQPSVSFVGGSGGDALTSPTGNATGITGNADRTIINVYANTGFTAQNYQHTFHMGTAACEQAYGISSSRAGNQGSAIGNHYWCSGFDTSATASANPNIAVATWDGEGDTGGRDAWSVNGANVGEFNRAALATGADQIQIGSRLSPFTEGFTGNISEVLVYDRALNGAERAILENHMSAKYNVPIANDHYDGDLPANGNYDLEVFGIGRIDAGNQLASSGAAGLGMTDIAGSLDDGDFLLAGHAAAENGFAAIPGGRRWLRTWYLQETGDVDVRLTFDHTTAGLTSEPGATYTLLYSADGVAFSPFAGATALVSGERVFFNLTSDQLVDGYYTLSDDTAADPPIIVASAGATAYRATDPGATIDDALLLTDADNTELQGASVTVAQGFTPGQDKLGFVNQLGLTGSYDGAAGVLTISGTASLDDYQQALRSVTYSNNSLSTAAGLRTIVFRGFDGNSFSDDSGAKQVDVSLPPLTGGTGPGGFEVADGAGSLRMWLDSTDTATLFTDTAGATTVSNGGDLVARWNDKSGYGLDVLQDSAANRPSFAPAVGNMNSQAAVGFAGGAGGDALTSPTGNATGILGNDDRTIINVFASTGFSSQNYQHTFHMGSTNCNEAYGISAARAGNAGSPIGNHYWCAGFDTTTAASTNANIAIAAWDGDGGTAGNGLDQWHVNGVDSGASDRGALNTGAAQLQVGSRLSPFTEGFTGNMTEVLIYDRLLNSAERSIVDNYLGAKYDVPIGDDLYDGDLPANNDYDVQVFGVGRDDVDNQVLASGAGGLGIETVSLDDGDYLLAGRTDASAGYVAVPTGRYWLRNWYLDKTGDVDATLTFDHSDAGQEFPEGVNFQLYYSADSENFAPLAGATATVIGDGVSFDLASADLADGYYALGDDTIIEPPVVQVSAGQIDYQATNPAVTIDSGLAVSDADSAQLEGGAVSIIAGFVAGQDVLGFVDQLGVSGSYNRNTGVLSLSGTADVADYEQALRSITFANISANAAAGSRSILFQVFDGDAFSDDAATREIVMTAPALTGGTGPGGFEFADGGGSLRMWLDSVDQSTLFTDTAGATTVANDGDLVARWNDKSGYGLDVVQDSSGNRPAFASTVANLNDQAAVSFIGGGGGDALTSPTGNSTGISGNDDRTIINVWANTGFTSQNYQHTFHMGSTNCNEAYGISASRAGNEGSPIGNHYWCAGFDTTTAASTNSNIAVAAWDGDGGTAGNGLDQWHINGANAGASDQAVLNTGVAQLQIGSRLSPFTEGFTGNLTEVLVYDRLLNSAERSIVENHLGAKYNVEVDNNRYSGDDPANGDYDWDVIGIGRDDASNLVSQAGMAGFGIQDASLLDDGDYVLAGHNSPANSLVDLPGSGQRWQRVWYVDKTGGIDAMFHFDFSAAGLALPAAGDTYSLLYSSTDGGPFTDLGIGGTVSVDSVSFAVSDADMQNGYYTLGVNLNADPVVDAGGPYVIDEGQSLSLAGSATDENNDPLSYSWDLNGDSVFDDATGPAPTLSWSQLQALGINDGPSSFDVTLRVTDGQGGAGESSATLTVNNAAPTADAGGPYTIDEGSGLSLNGSASDANDVIAITWDLNGDGVFGDANGATPTLSWTDLQALGIEDGPSTFDVTLRVDDGQGGVTTSATTLTVDNVAPTADAGGPYQVIQGGSITLSATATDPGGALDPITFRWDLDGDGIFGEVGAAATRGDELGAGPTFSAAGLSGPSLFDVRLIASDDDGGSSAVVVESIEIVPPVFLDSGGNLVIQGGGRNDRVIIYAGPRKTTLVRLNDSRFGPFEVGAGGRIIAWGDSGQDRITVAGNLSSLTELHGGAGNDYIAGGRNDDVLLGEDGNDILLGGDGNNSLDGGAGNDQLTTRGGDDILRGGSGNDVLQGGSGPDVLDGGSGNDRLSGGQGSDLLIGGLGNDRLVGSDGADVLIGGLGNDTLRGDGDNDLLVGGSGADALQGGRGQDVLIGGNAANEDDEAALLAVLAEWTSTGDYSGLGAISDDGEADGLSGGASRDDVYAASDDLVQPDNNDTIFPL